MVNKTNTEYYAKSSFGDPFGGPSGFYLNAPDTPVNDVMFTATKREARQRRSMEFEEFLDTINWDDVTRGDL